MTTEEKIDEVLEIGVSPISGICLTQVLEGHYQAINQLAWSADGKYLASPSKDKTIHIWDCEKGESFTVLTGHTSNVNSVSWSPTQFRLASASDDNKLFIWSNIKENNAIRLDRQDANCVAWSPDGRIVASISTLNSIRLWNENGRETLMVIQGDFNKIKKIKWAPITSQYILAACCADGNVHIWNINPKRWNTSRRFSLRHSKVSDLSWLLNSNLIATCGGDNTIKIWDNSSGELKHTLEGHTGEIKNISFSSDGSLLASKGVDGVRIWRCDTWEAKTLIEETIGDSVTSGLAFHPFLPYLATLGMKDTLIRVWKIDYEELINAKPSIESIRYTTAKLVLVGDSGVGKTGLGWRLAHNEFKEHASTHGQQFWVIPELGLKRKDGTECEAVLWDLAGQHVYRSIHSIFLDNVDASIILFDPSNRQDPLKGAQFWLEQLRGKKQLPPSILVGARVDRGAAVLSQQELDQFCQKYGISGGYVGTSAKSGEGLDKLLENLKGQILWDKMTTTVTTITFKRIKEYVLSLKEKTDRKGVLVRPIELAQQLENSTEDWQFTSSELLTAVGHLANHGYVSILHSSSGEEYILLVPELLASVASSIFLHADKHPRELGAINESDLLNGKYPIDEFNGLEREEQQVLLDSTVVRFLEHNICFRETYGNDNLLIFPSLIKQKRPLKDDIPSTDDISYIVRGRVENLYAVLVVLLGYTSSFNRINQWQNQAQYETDKGDICGFRLIEDREGEIELVLYYGNRMPKEHRSDFQKLFEQFLYQREVEVIKFPPVVCPNGHRQERATVVKRSREGKESVFCDECGAKTDLPNLEQPQMIGIDSSEWLKGEESIARLRSVYETSLARVKGYRRGWETPRCYISHISAQNDIAQKLSHDLSDAGIYVVEEPSKVATNDIVIVLDSPAYEKAWQNHATFLQEDAKLIQSRLSSKKLISVVTDGKVTKFHDLHGCNRGDFCDETHYSISLFDLVLNLYAIPLDHAGFAPLRQILHQQWEQSLTGTKGNSISNSLKVFISYSHKDEDFKDELVTMLASLQRRGIIDAWQDRCIEEGDEWYQDIQDAMTDCELAILLVSANFLASRFIQDEELPKLLKRRSEKDLRVVPIVVKQCMWQSEPVIKDLQVLPRDGKPVITFSKENGDRDQVWTDIAKAIEKRARK